MRMRVRDYLARILAGTKTPVNEFVKTQLLRSSKFHSSIQRRSDGHSGHRTGDIVRCYRLKTDRWHVNRVAIGCFVGDALQELEELRRPHDRIRDRGFLDQLLLCDLRTEVAAVRQTFRADDRQCHMMS